MQACFQKKPYNYIKKYFFQLNTNNFEFFS